MKIKFFCPVSGHLNTFNLFLLSIVTADDPFEHFDWQNEIDVSYSKPWMSYIHAYIGEKSSHLIGLFAKFKSKVSFIQMISLFARRQTSKKLMPNVGIPFVKKYNWRPFFIETEVVFPLFELQNSKIFMFYNHKTPRREVIIVSAQKLLRSKITFVKLQIYSSFHMNSCELNVTIHSATRKSDAQKFTFCGIYNNFTFYPHGNKIYFFLHYLNPEDFELEVVYDILAMNVIKYSSLELEGRSDIQLSKFNIDVMAVETIVFVHKLVAKKTHYFSVTLNQNIQTLFYDGPGFLAEYTRVNTTSKFSSSSFVCFLQIIQSVQREEVSDDILTFSSVLKELNQNILIDQNSTTLYYDSAECFERTKTPGCTKHFLLKFSSASHLNVSTKQFNFTGHEDLNCTFGGVSFFDINNTEPNLIRSVCMNSGADGQNIQNVYSDSNELIVLVYSFKNYGLLKVGMQFSSTTCKPIKHDPCSDGFVNKYHDISKQSFYFSRNN